jgi:predicted acylesterase/phospholipase RssA
MSTKIKHIVMSGGGGVGLAFYGILRESCSAGFWKMSDIETMHSTSAGSIIMMSLPIIEIIGWDSYDDFLIKRPWERVFEISADRVFKSYSNVGLFDRETVDVALQPLFSAVDLSLNTTLQEFYEFSGVEMHWYSTNLDEYRLEDISYKTHPNWTVIDATYCSSAFPIMFRPGNVNGVSYSDGGTFCGYPLMRCVPLVENTDEIFGLCKNNYHKTRGYTKHRDYANLLDYLSDLVLKTVDCLEEEEKIPIKHMISVQGENTTVVEVIEALKTQESRSAKIKTGVDAWIEFSVSMAKV